VNTLTHRWTSVTRHRIRDVQDSLIEMSEWARESQVDKETMDLLLLPYRELLDSIYQRDLPLAKLVDQSDLLLHVRGSAASGPTPRVSVVTKFLTSARDQVTRLAKQMGHIEAFRVPSALDMGFVGVAEGSLFLGFSAAPAEDGDLTREAIKTIAQASFLISEESTIHELASAIHDPATRDMALSAIHQLAPSGLTGVSEVDILGRSVRATSLTTETRRVARRIMAQPVAREEPATYVGTVREMDLDSARFEIRNVDGHPDAIRCAHELDEDDVKQIVDKRVRVRGIPEFGPRHTVRLLWVDEVEVLDD
jgi:hypothetical protein